MKKLLSLFCFLFFIADVFSQSKGDVLVGVNTDLTSYRLIDVSLSPVFGYQVSKNFQMGATVNVISSNNTNFDFIEIYGKYYPNCVVGVKSKPFIRGQVGISASDSYSIVGGSIGLTSYVGSSSWFFLEPQIGWLYSNYSTGNHKFGVSLSCGIKL